jgi:hypothetical protein
MMGNRRFDEANRAHTVDQGERQPCELSISLRCTGTSESLGIEVASTVQPDSTCPGPSHENS